MFLTFLVSNFDKSNLNSSIEENIYDISSTFLVEKLFKFRILGLVLYKNLFIEINSFVSKPFIVKSYKFSQFSNVLTIEVI